MKKPVAIILGGIPSHMPLIQNLKSKGYYTILFDYYENPPAKKYADSHYPISTLDEEAILNFAKENNPNLIITACLDQPIPVACRVAKKLGLPFPYPETTALQATDKELMKQVFVENGVLTPKHIILEHYYKDNEYLQRFNLPLIVKPVDSTGSQGVYKVSDSNQFDRFFLLAQKASQSRKVIIEEYIEGIELGIDCFVSESMPFLLTVRRKLKNKATNQQLTLGSIHPYRLSSDDSNVVKNSILSIITAFNLENTPLLVQGVLANGRFYILEIAARVGGGMNYENVKKSCGFDLIDATINSYLGRKTSINIIPENRIRGVIHLYVYGGVFHKVIGAKRLLEDETIDSIKVLKEKGEVFNDQLTSKSKIAKVLLSAENEEKMVEKIIKLTQTIDVVSLDEHSMLHKEMLWDYNTIHAK